MKKTILILWSAFGLSLLLFALSVAFTSTQTAWKVLSFVALTANVAFWGTIISLIADKIKKKK